MTIDFREFAAREDGLTKKKDEIINDPFLADKIRLALRQKGMKIPLTEDELFAEANERMKK